MRAQAPPTGPEQVWLSGKMLDAASGRPVAATNVRACQSRLSDPYLSDSSGLFDVPADSAIPQTLCLESDEYYLAPASALMRYVPTASRDHDISIRLLKYGAIAGDVVDESGAPLQNASVVLLRRQIV